EGAKDHVGRLLRLRQTPELALHRIIEEKSLERNILLIGISLHQHDLVAWTGAVTHAVRRRVGLGPVIEYRAPPSNPSAARAKLLHQQIHSARPARQVRARYRPLTDAHDPNTHLILHIRYKETTWRSVWRRRSSRQAVVQVRKLRRFVLPIECTLDQLAGVRSAPHRFRRLRDRPHQLRQLLGSGIAQ